MKSRKIIAMSAATLLAAFGTFSATNAVHAASFKQLNSQEVTSGVATSSTKQDHIRTYMDASAKTRFNKNDSHGEVKITTNLFNHQNTSVWDFYRNHKLIMVHAADEPDVTNNWTNLSYPVRDLNYLSHAKQLKGIQGLFLNKNIKHKTITTKNGKKYVISSNRVDHALSKYFNKMTWPNHDQYELYRVRKAKITEIVSHGKLKNVVLTARVMQGKTATRLHMSFDKLNQKQDTAMPRRVKAAESNKRSTNFGF